MDVSDLRVALITGNYNMVRDGPTQALGRLVQHLLDHGAAVRIFAPTIPDPQVDQPGEIVSVPSIALPGRSASHAIGASLRTPPDPFGD